MTCDDGYQPEVLIAGQPQAYEYLKSPMAGDWNGHAFSAHTMPPLEPIDVCIFIKERLNSVGLPEAVFSVPARILMGNLAGGSFTTTNLLCQMSLILAQQQSASFVDEQLVRSAYAALGQGQKQIAARTVPANYDTDADGEIFVRFAGSLVARHQLEDQLLLGRAEWNQICLRSAEVSRSHATIFRADNGFYIKDLDSVNGLTVNDEQYTRHKLTDRDVIAIGPFQLTFAAPAALEKRAARLPPRRAAEEAAKRWPNKIEQSYQWLRRLI